jgi:tetratricopeptide (TPR) repeat protein
MGKNQKIALICLFLAAVTFAAFHHVTRCDFILFDDNYYVTENLNIQNGISLEAVRWAFTTGHAANWHPVTWISHMLDVQWFGLAAGWHHLTNLLFHIANTLLLFLVLCRMTGKMWRSASVAMLFAVHPLHVESVAWVAERKDVLSTFFWMLTLGAYSCYVQRPGLKRYLPVAVFLALGLMSKPMLVTLPFVLLLMDYWPLRRLEVEIPPPPETRAVPTGPAPAKKKKRKAAKERQRAEKAAVVEDKPSERRLDWALAHPLVLEKIPLFVLVALSCAATYIAQQKSGAIATIPLWERVGNAFVSYIAYILQMVWPSGLAVFYPHPGAWPLWQVLGAALALVGITAAVIRQWKKFPYLASGWLWYLGTLVPVIGIVQVGSQARADRYTYIPLIGLFIVVAWGLPELLKKWRWRGEALIVASAVAFSFLFVTTLAQVEYWQNSLAVFDHALAVTGDNATIRCNRGHVYGRLGRLKEALADYDMAIKINPEYVEALDYRGAIHCRLGEFHQAFSDFARAIELNPQYPEAYNDRGAAYDAKGEHAFAIADYNRAIEINPRYWGAYYNRARACLAQGDYARVIEDCTRSIEINPRFAEAYNLRGIANDSLGNYDRAAADFGMAVRINPRFAKAYYNRALTYGKMGNRDQSIENLKIAARFNNESAKNSLKSMGLSW